MNLTFLEKEENLIGKTIAYTHMTQFAECIIIATTDKCILCVCQNEDEIEIYNKQHAEREVFGNKWLIQELEEKNVITKEDVNDYKERIEEARLKNELEIKKYNEEQERKEYERLKAKFEKGDK